MSRIIRVAAGQLGAIPEGTRREECVNGYNTPLYALALEHDELALREDGVEFSSGNCVIDLLGEVVTRASTIGHKLETARIDLDQLIPVRRRWSFLGRRHPEHYGLITEPVEPTP